MPEPKEVTDPIRTLDIKERGISTIPWGERVSLRFFLGALSDLCKPPVAEAHTRHYQRAGAIFSPPTLAAQMESAFLFGVGEDAQHFAVQIAASV